MVYLMGHQISFGYFFSKTFRTVHVFYHSYVANWESLPFENKQNLHKLCGCLWHFTAESAAQANNELRKTPTLHDPREQNGGVV